MDSEHLFIVTDMDADGDRHTFETDDQQARGGRAEPVRGGSGGGEAQRSKVGPAEMEHLPDDLVSR